MSYSDELKHPMWQRKRLERLSAADWKCTRCSADDKPLHVHHTIYRDGARPWEYPDAELVVLCESCHDFEHKPTRSEAEYQRAIALAEEFRADALKLGQIAMRYADERLAASVAEVRAADEKWRLDNPVEAAEFDARKARALAALGAAH